MSVKFTPHSNDILQNKFKILLYCNTADFHPWFEIISDKIQELLDCSILNPRDEEKYLTDTCYSNSIHLLMVLITENSLYKEDPILDQYLANAIHNHLPVFYLRVSELDFDAFESKFDTLHCLDASTMTSSDTKKLNHFNDQFRKKLHQLLASDDEMERILSSFSASIFLSYRKKDYQHVRALMKLFHDDPRFRDVAVWFDDYLIPGENYTLAIEQAITESKAFALLVTPKLLSDDNYVMKTEYPLAKKNNIPVFPFEILETNESDLAKKYPDIPKCIDMSDKAACETILNQLIDSLHLQSPNNAPEHLFYIGLAYLMGINVEKNGHFAKELIEKALAGGYHDGMLKLAFMYAEGNGIAKDYNLAIFWLEKYLAMPSEIPTNMENPFIFLEKQNRDEETEQLRFIIEKRLNATLLLNALYKKTGTYHANSYSSIIDACQEYLRTLMAFYPLITNYDIISGYKRIKEPDGKTEKLVSIHKQIWKTTGLIVHWEFIDVLEEIAMLTRPDIDDLKRFQFLTIICATYHRMLEMNDPQIDFKADDHEKARLQKKYSLMVDEKTKALRTLFRNDS